MTHRLHFSTLLLASALSAPVFAAVDINGDLDQRYDAINAPVTGIAIGDHAKATNAINDISGNVTVRGSVTQRYRAINSPITGIAVGNGAEANNFINRVSGN